jgi:hypothetical protein
MTGPFTIADCLRLAEHGPSKESRLLAVSLAIAMLQAALVRGERRPRLVEPAKEPKHEG